MKLPPLACDCHVHVIGPASAYPMDEHRNYTPGPASPEDLLAHMQRFPLARAVLIQPSVYGTDNRCMLDCLQQMSGAGRGIAVLPDNISDAELFRLADMGIKGVRINLESSGNRDPDAVRDSLKKWSDRLAPLDWHIQIYASFKVITATLDILATLPVPVVLDHFAMIPVGLAQLDTPDLRAFLHQLRTGNLYVKLSAAYRIAAPQTATPDTASEISELASALLDANPDRILWASDWPHTNREPGKLPKEVSAYRSISVGRLTDELAAWLPTDELARKVLVENPAKLYQF